MHTNLNLLQRITTKSFNDLKPRLTKPMLQAWQASFTLNGTKYEILPRPDANNIHGTPTGFYLVWVDDDGNQAQQFIKIDYTESNLKAGCRCWYFICPYTGKRCRTLYTDGAKFFSRYALTYGYTYTSQQRTHRQRKINLPDIPYNVNGKERYRGTLTPYGKRIAKATDKYEKAEYALRLDAARYLCHIYARR